MHGRKVFKIHLLTLAFVLGFAFAAFASPWDEVLKSQGIVQAQMDGGPGKKVEGPRNKKREFLLEKSLVAAIEKSSGPIHEIIDKFKASDFQSYAEFVFSGAVMAQTVHNAFATILMKEAAYRGITLSNDNLSDIGYVNSHPKFTAYFNQINKEIEEAIRVKALELEQKRTQMQSPSKSTPVSP